MTGVLQCLLLSFLLTQVYGYKTCHLYLTSHHQQSLTLIRCSNSEYCCDKGCCRKVYSIWYFWTLLLFGLFVALIFCWWYKAHRYRQHTRVVQRGAIIPMQVVQPYPQQAMHRPNQPMPQYPTYPYAFAPPPYSAAVNPPTYGAPAQMAPTYGAPAQMAPIAGRPKL